MQVDTPQQPLEDARRLIGAASNAHKDINADCIFQDWSTECQMEAYRHLNKIQDRNDNIPDLTLHTNGSNYHLVQRETTEPYSQYCRAAAEHDASIDLPHIEFNEADRLNDYKDRNVDFNLKIAADKNLDGWESEADSKTEPEDPANTIESLAKKTLSGDEEAKLDLRVQLDDLMRETKADFRDQVLETLLEDGTSLFGDSPFIAINRDADGNPQSIQFSGTRFSGTTETIALNKTMEEQVAEANDAYVEEMDKKPAERGRLNPAKSARDIETLTGEAPEDLKWFMIYRQQQGLPALDLSTDR